VRGRVVLNNLSAETREWYQQAVYCAQQADAQSDPKVKQQFLELKRLWLLLARSYGLTESLTDLSSATKQQADKLAASSGTRGLL
jgi:hypothetical protein